MSNHNKPKPLEFVRVGMNKADAAYRYTACGLDNVYLLNGFTRKETPYGVGVAVEDVSGLHQAIGMNIIRKAGRLSASELRFLRADLELTQAQMAEKLSADVQSIGRYERGENEIPGPTDKLVRTLYYVYRCSDDELKKFMEELESQMSKMADKLSSQQMFEKTDDEWQRRQVSM